MAIFHYSCINYRVYDTLKSIKNVRRRNALTESVYEKLKSNAYTVVYPISYVQHIRVIHCYVISNIP